MSKHTYRLIQGYSSRSASPTDIWQFQRDDGVLCIGKVYIQKIKNKPIESAIFLDREAYIYQQISKRNQPCNDKFFVQFSDFLTNLSVDDLLKYVRQIQGVGREYLLENLIRSIWYMKTQPIGFFRTPISLDEVFRARPPLLEMEEALNKERLLNIRFGIIITIETEHSTLYDYLERAEERIDLLEAQKPKKKFQWLRKQVKPPLPPEGNIVSVLFYAISVLSNLGFNQNDMHWGNVLVERNAMKVPYFIVFQDTCFKITNPDIPKLFDFDRGVERGKDFALLERYEQSGTCTFYHPYRDLLRAICLTKAEEYDILLEYIKSSKIREHIENEDEDCDLYSEVDDTNWYCSKEMDKIQGAEMIKWMLTRYNEWYPFKLIDENHIWMTDLYAEIERDEQKESKEKKRKMVVERFCYSDNSIKNKVDTIAKNLFYNTAIKRSRQDDFGTVQVEPKAFPKVSKRKYLARNQ